MSTQVGHIPGRLRASTLEVAAAAAGVDCRYLTVAYKAKSPDLARHTTVGVA
jgi:hypothetical protein